MAPREAPHRVPASSQGEEDEGPLPLQEEEPSVEMVHLC